MHQFLRAVGFKRIRNREELDFVLKQVIAESGGHRLTRGEDGILRVQMEKEFAPGMGIAVRGEYDEDGEFHLDHYYPYLKNTGVTAAEEIVINKRIDTDAFTGMCEDIRLGVSLIFYLQNSMDYLDNQSVIKNGSFIAPLHLSGLSAEGKVILGVDSKEADQETHHQETTKRNQLIAEARKGNQEAIDSLTVDDIDLFASISRRTKTEDIYSIVESSFIPYGSESDNYSVLGTILSSEEYTNENTGEKIYVLLVNCNDLEYSICINKEDLMGEPEAGRRFRGTIWLQGQVDFQ
ncbi:DUF3881 family protein [Anaerolentibacter hominis]|uniref:DUF3881 family protein n=1 Tax=Anaerolentibacter hominis TaxID=3079009 RepID=UPI0031B8A49E